MKNISVLATLALLSMPVWPSDLPDLPTTPAASVHILRLEQQFVSEHGNRIRPDKIPDKRIFSFTLIPGSLRWKFLELQLDIEAITTGEDGPVLNLDDWQKRVAQLARPLDEYDIKHGYHVTPSDTRIARVVSRAFYSATRRRLGAYTLFADTPRDNELILLYVDRPCRIVARRELKSGVSTLDLNIDAPGFHLITDSRNEDGTGKFSVIPPPRDVAMVTVFE